MPIIFAVCTNSDMQIDSNSECNCPVDTYQWILQDGTIVCTDCPTESTTQGQTGFQSIDGCGNYSHFINSFISFCNAVIVKENINGLFF